MLHPDIHNQRASGHLHDVRELDNLQLACPKCGSDEDYDYYLEWGTVNHYDCICSCGHEWHTIGLYK